MSWLGYELICHFSQDKCQEPQEGTLALRSASLNLLVSFEDYPVGQNQLVKDF